MHTIFQVREYFLQAIPQAFVVIGHTCRANLKIDPYNKKIFLRKHLFILLSLRRNINMTNLICLFFFKK